MSKTSNTIIFVLLATIVNILMIFAILILCIFIASNLFDLNNNTSLSLIVLAISFIISIGGSLFIYSKLVKWASVKFDLDSKLTPLFYNKNKR